MLTYQVISDEPTASANAEDNQDITMPLLGIQKYSQHPIRPCFALALCFSITSAICLIAAGPLAVPPAGTSESMRENMYDISTILITMSALFALLAVFSAATYKISKLSVFNKSDSQLIGTPERESLSLI